MTTNTYAGICANCGGEVAPGAGLVNGKLGDGSWRVVGDCCIPDGTPGAEPVINRIIFRRIRHLVEELEKLDPEEIDYIRTTPQAALLREWLGARPKLEFDL
jgi:hypothetical protein